MVRASALIFLAMLAGCMPTPRATKDASTPVTTAPQLAADFQSNEIAAKAKYPGSVIIVGEVTSVTQDLTGPANVQLDGGGTPVGVGMWSSVPTWAASLRPGYRIAVLCNQPKLMLGAVIASGCVPQELPPQPKPAKHRHHRR